MESIFLIYFLYICIQALTMQNIVQWMSPNSIKLISTILSSGVVIFFFYPHCSWEVECQFDGREEKRARGL